MDATLLSKLSTPKAQRFFWIALTLLILGVGVKYTVKIACSERDTRSAFLRWRNQILDLDNRADIYIKHNYPNPPIMALLLRPLARLPRVLGALVWFFLKVAMAGLVFRWVFRLVPDPERPFPFWGKALAVFLSTRPLVGDLTHGNINIFILFLVVGALYAFQNKRDVLAGLVLALAIACKVTPFLFVPYFLWKRAWKTLAGCVVGLILFLWFIPGSLLGFSYNADLLNRWTQQMIVPFVVEGQVTTEHQNQSLPGVVHRLMTESASFSVYTDEGYVPVATHNFVNLDPEILRWVLKICLFLFAGLVVLTCRTAIATSSPHSSRTDWRLAVEYSIIFLGMLLFSERTWKHHCVTLVMPFSVLVYQLSVRPLTKNQRHFLIGGLGLAVALIMTTSSGLFGRTADFFAELAEVYGAYVWAHLVLLGMMGVILYWENRQTIPRVVSWEMIFRYSSRYSSR